MQQLLQQVVLRRAGKKLPSGQAGEAMTWYRLVNVPTGFWGKAGALG